MKVLMINVSCGTGSTGRICTDLASSLEKSGHEVKIAYGRDQVSPQFEKYAVKIGTNFEVNLHAVHARLFDASGLGSKIGTYGFIKWVKQYNPDIIHLHNIHGYYINVPILFDYLKTCEKPIIWTLHDCWCFTGHTAFCESANCDRWKSERGSCPLLSQYPMAYIDRSKRNWKWKKSCFTNVPNLSLVTPSKWLAGLVKQSFMKAYPIDVIHNGIDTSLFIPLRNDFKNYHGLEGKRILLGVASVWNTMKGFDDFLKLSRLLDDNTAIVMVGLTPQQIQQLPPNIIGIGRTNSVKELNYIYDSADVFLNLTYCDNYQTTNLEARACQIPRITYETGESPESAGRNAIIVKKGDVEGVWKEVRFLLSSDKANTFEKAKVVKDTVSEYIEKSTREGYFKHKGKLGLLGKTIVMGIASVWDQRKGLKDLISITKELDNTFQLILIGLSESQMNSLPANVIGIKKTNSVKELSEFYSISDVLINPTYEDNYPTVNLEAASCNTPVITYRTGGSVESVAEEMVVNKGDIHRVVTILYEKKYVNRKIEDLDQNTMMNNYMAVYQKKTKKGRYE